MNYPGIIILGAGPAGLGAAYKLAQSGFQDITLLEQNQFVGGNAGSFDIAGLRVDYGSHRLHPSCDPLVMADIHKLLGDDLLDRPRHGRIFLQGRWIHFPLKPLDLVLRLPPGFAMGVAIDTMGKIFPSKIKDDTNASFATVMQRGLGSTICNDFYFPYARKIWGEDPNHLSAIQARRRVSAGSVTKMIKKVLASVPGIKPEGSGRFYYPRYGFGQISEAYAKAAHENGVRFELGSSITAVEHHNGAITIRYRQNDNERSIIARNVWSTIPITTLARLLRPAPPDEITQAAFKIAYRSILLIYLVLEQDRFSEYDAHYFPNPGVRITRLSEPKNYCASDQPAGRTVLCAELPCNAEDPEWQESDEVLRELVVDSLAQAGLPIQSQISSVFVRRLRYAYPIYLLGYENHFHSLDNWIGGIEGLLIFGRQGLFAHDNTHHALFMAYCAVECLNQDRIFDHLKWQSYRQIFDSHVVED